MTAAPDTVTVTSPATVPNPVPAPVPIDLSTAIAAASGFAASAGTSAASASGAAAAAAAAATTVTSDLAISAGAAAMASAAAGTATSASSSASGSAIAAAASATGASTSAAAAAVSATTASTQAAAASTSAGNAATSATGAANSATAAASSAAAAALFDPAGYLSKVNPVATGTVTAPNFWASSAASPGFVWSYTAAAVDSKLWDAYADATVLRFRALNDTWASASTWMAIARSGYTITAVNFPSSNVGVNGTNAGGARELGVTNASATANTTARMSLTTGTAGGYTYLQTAEVGSGVVNSYWYAGSAISRSICDTGNAFGGYEWRIQGVLKAYIDYTGLINASVFQVAPSAYFTMSGSNPALGCDANDYMLYDRTGNNFQFFIASTLKGGFNSTGVFGDGSQLTNIPSAAKAWAVWYWNGSAVVINASSNTASIVRNGVGDYTITFTAALASANYCVEGALSGTYGVAAAVYASGGPGTAPTLKTTTQCRVLFSESGVGTFDPTAAGGGQIQFFGG
ncbi:hypothetical protein EYW49_20505 [Siculibacillus lacustris]|uniref:Uncharacterized protein n=1 Tax=Siculibacillus lacustris TaxID=1549641 RepID=A0A4Q9VF75_9HYPH|nr:hypothetical protein [Siculibacillus lacustris]TBW33343.1 hypothetical protein EYW49_20505 [Siculibacillus lacustris]